MKTWKYPDGSGRLRITMRSDSSRASIQPVQETANNSSVDTRAAMTTTRLLLKSTNNGLTTWRR
jgi:hypothetical protein